MGLVLNCFFTLLIPQIILPSAKKVNRNVTNILQKGVSILGKDIKIRLLQLDKTQVELAAELRKRGFRNVDGCGISKAVSGYLQTPLALKIKEEIYEVLDERLAAGKDE